MKKYPFILFTIFIVSIIFSAKTYAISSPNPDEIKNLINNTVGESTNENNIVDEIFHKLSAPREGLQKIFEKINSDEEITKEEQDLLEIQLQKEILEDLNSVISSEIEEMQKKVGENDKLKEELEKANKKTNEYTKTIKELENTQDSLRKKITEKESIIKENESSIEKLSESEVMKNYLVQQNLQLKNLLEQNEDKKKNQKMNILYLGVSLFLLAFLLKYILKKKFKKQYEHHFTYFDIIWGFSIFSFLIWFFFYVRPEMTIILFFLAGGFVIVSKDFIVSLFSSLLIINEFHIGDKIRFNDKDGIIVKIRPLWVIIRNIDKYNHATGEARRIPNYIFVSKEVTRIRKIEENEYFKISLNREYKLNIFQILKYIETEILQKNIITKIKDEVWGEEKIYDIDYSYNEDGEPQIEITWKETKEKSRRIKKKIMAYINSMIFKEEKKEIKEENDNPQQEKKDKHSTLPSKT